MTDWEELVEPGRAILSAPRLGRAERASSGPSDEKFALGDLFLGVEDEQLEWLAGRLGHNLTGAGLRSYREVAAAWPPEKRVAASWTTHRTLKNAPDRFDVIKPGMTLRQAQQAIGKQPADTEHPSRWSLDRKVPFIVTQLMDATTNKAVRDDLDGKKGARAARAAAKMVDEERSAEYREALRELREARDAKSAERMLYEVIFKLREFREYLRAIGKASGDEMSFLRADRRPDVVAVVQDLALTAVEVLRQYELEGEAAATDALAAIRSNAVRDRDTKHDPVIIAGEVYEMPMELASRDVAGSTSG